jgi:large-conductance mechanosensitive channel
MALEKILCCIIFAFNVFILKKKIPQKTKQKQKIQRTKKKRKKKKAQNSLNIRINCIPRIPNMIPMNVHIKCMYTYISYVN